MTFQKPAEQGWFYHAPAKTRSAEPLGVPPLSQIAQLSDTSHMPEELLPKTKYRDTDSKYVRLAKKGGRDDLLVFDPKRGYKSSNEPMNYPQCDWFYLEDNRVQDASNTEENKDYKFMLPEYMVHEEYEDSKDGGFRPKRAPFGYDRNSIFETDKDPTKKDLKLPEDVKQGYGLRAEKLKNKPVPHKNPPPPKPIRQEEATNLRSYKPVWQKKNPSNDKHPNSIRQSDLVSEYQAGYVKREPKAGRRATPKNIVEKRPPPKTAAQGAKKQPENDKDLFKMSRFKNVPARTESHRPVTVQVGD